MKIWIEKIHLDLVVNWKLSRNQTNYKENFIVHLETPLGHFKSEVAPNIRYGETPTSIEEEFSSFNFSAIENLSDLALSLKEIKAHSLRFGLESVYISYFAAQNQQTLSGFLGLTPMKAVETSFSMPIMPIGEIASYLAPLSRYKSLKIKVNAESAMEMLSEIRKHTSVKLRVDANEGWRDLDTFMKFQESLKGMNIELIEQPFPSQMHAEYRELKNKTPYKILADESIEDAGDFSELSKEFHAINIKLMKTGSLLVAREFITQARAHQLEVMMGCMIETTIGIHYGMLFSGMVDYVDLDGFLLIKDEPFHLVKEAEGILYV